MISPIGTLLDKVQVGVFSLAARFQNDDAIFARPEIPTLVRLSGSGAGGGLGLSPAIVDRFFKPFFQGIFLVRTSHPSFVLHPRLNLNLSPAPLSPSLTQAPLENQSSRMFDFVFRMFTIGSATLPAGGMGQAAAQV